MIQFLYSLSDLLYVGTRVLTALWEQQVQRHGSCPGIDLCHHLGKSHFGESQRTTVSNFLQAV